MSGEEQDIAKRCGMGVGGEYLIIMGSNGRFLGRGKDVGGGGKLYCGVCLGDMVRIGGNPEVMRGWSGDETDIRKDLLRKMCLLVEECDREELGRLVWAKVGRVGRVLEELFDDVNGLLEKKVGRRLWRNERKLVMGLVHGRRVEPDGRVNLRNGVELLVDERGSLPSDVRRRVTVQRGDRVVNVDREWYRQFLDKQGGLRGGISK